MNKFSVCFVCKNLSMINLPFLMPLLRVMCSITDNNYNMVSWYVLLPKNGIYITMDTTIQLVLSVKACFEHFNQYISTTNGKYWKTLVILIIKMELNYINIIYTIKCRYCSIFLCKFATIEHRCTWVKYSK